MLDNIKHWWKGLAKSQKYSLIVTILILTLLPTSLLAFKYQRVFFSKAAGNGSGVIAVIDTASNDEYANSANPEASPPPITSAIVRLRITFPTNLLSVNNNQNAHVNLAQTKQIKSAVLANETLGDCQGACGNSQTVQPNSNCTNPQWNKISDVLNPDQTPKYQNCSAQYPYCYSCSNTPSNPSPSSPPSSQGTGFTGNIPDCKGTNISGSCGSVGSGSNTTYCDYGPGNVGSGHGSCGVDYCFVYSWDKCLSLKNAAKTGVSNPSNPTSGSNGGNSTGSFKCEEQQGQCLENIGSSTKINNITYDYCDYGTSGHGSCGLKYCYVQNWNTNCPILKSAKPTNTATNPSGNLPSSDKQTALSKLTQPGCADSQGYIRDRKGEKIKDDKGIDQKCTDWNGGQTNADGSYQNDINNCYNPNPDSPKIGSAAFANQANSHYYNSCPINPDLTVLACPPGVAYCGGGGGTSGGGGNGDVCSDSAPCAAGLNCVLGQDRVSHCRNQNGTSPQPVFTKLMLIKNENVADFSNPDTYIAFSYTDDQAALNAGHDLTIPYYALSDGAGSKTITVRFCPNTSPADSLCKDVSVSVNLTYPQTTPISVQSVDQGVRSAAATLTQLGENVEVTDNGFSLSQGTVNLPDVSRLTDADLEFLIYVLKAKLNIHPYFALCQYFTNPVDIRRLDNLLSKYGSSAPNLPAVWTKDQLQALAALDPQYAAYGQYLQNLSSGAGLMPLPCKFDQSRPDTYAIFPALKNAPPQLNKNQIALSGTNLELVSPDPSNANEVNIFQQKLVAYAALEEMTWQAADIPIGDVVNWVVTLADGVPYVPYPGAGGGSLIWRHMLPGDTISAAINLKDKGAPLGFVGAKYGAELFGSLALLVNPESLGSTGLKVTSRVATFLKKAGTNQDLVPFVNAVVKETVEGREMEVAHVFYGLGTQEVDQNAGSLFNSASRFVVGGVDHFFVKLARQLGATDGQGRFLKTAYFADATAAENQLIQQLNWGIDNQLAFPLSTQNSQFYLNAYISDLLKDPDLKDYISFNLSKIQDIFNRRYIFIVTSNMLKALGGVSARGFARGKVVVLNASEFYSFPDLSSISALYDPLIIFLWRHEFTHLVQAIRQNLTWVYEFATENPDTIDKALSNIFELETDKVARMTTGNSSISLDVRRVRGYNDVIPNFAKAYRVFLEKTYAASNGQFNTGVFRRLALTGDHNLLAYDLAQFPEVKKLFQDFLSSYHIDYRGTAFE